MRLALAIILILRSLLPWGVSGGSMAGFCGGQPSPASAAPACPCCEPTSCPCEMSPAPASPAPSESELPVPVLDGLRLVAVHVEPARLMTVGWDASCPPITRAEGQQIRPSPGVSIQAVLCIWLT